MANDLDNLLLGEEPVEQKTEGRAFKPKFNVREEFVLWVREQFPELDKYAKGKKPYEALETRRKEIYEAGLGAVNHGVSSTEACASAKLSYGWNEFDNGFKDEADPKKRAKSLKKFVQSLEELSLSLGGNNHFTDCGRFLDGSSYSSDWYGNAKAFVYRVGDKESNDTAYLVFEEEQEITGNEPMTLIGEFMKLGKYQITTLKKIAESFRGKEEDFIKRVDREVPENGRHYYGGSSPSGYPGSYTYPSYDSSPLSTDLKTAFVQTARDIFGEFGGKKK